VAAIVDTRSGKVEGAEQHGVLVFRGVPFAAPPVGARRWRAPQREASWDGVRACTEVAPYIAQSDMMLEQMLGSGEIGRDEGALVLNVWTPGLDGKRPVMVWIHGGAFQFGSGSTPWYDGTRFASNGDVVLVTINYRLGPLGYLYLRDLLGDHFADSGNLGTLDQIASLEWVRDCIAAFGGDPDNVTIFGESAGAGSVGTLLGAPGARGLFAKAILQSGAASWGNTTDAATDKARRVIEALGITPSAPDVQERLYAASADDVVAASVVLGFETSGTSLPFAPVHDGVVLPEPPLDAIRAGSAAGVHVLCGTNHDEMTLFGLMDPTLASIDDAGVIARATHWYSDDVHTLVDRYKAAMPGATIQELWTAIATDAVFRIPGLRLVEAQLAHGPAWVYLFTWPSPAFGGALKSCHALEIPFVFDTLDAAGASMFTGEGPERRAIADRMHAAWIAFARSGSPEHAAIPAWPAYDVASRPTMRIDTEWQLVDDLDGRTRALWDSWNGFAG
jgi:para-nitrobenzyl esterase